MLASTLKPRCIAVFGSFARGDYKAESDLDLLLIGDQLPRRPFARGAAFGPISTDWRTHPDFSSFPKALSPFYISEKGWLESSGLRLSLSTEAWILHDDGLLGQSLAEARSWVAQGLWFKKPLSDGGWLWVPKGVQVA